MSARVTLATARRVLWQIRRDPRTIALLLVVPVGLLVLMRFVFRRSATDLPGDRGADVRAVPIHHHVSRHLDRDAA
jgi:hypothetical protein